MVMLHRTPARIAVLRALYLGDLLCAIPALNSLRCRFPEAEITLIGLPWTKAMMDRLPAVDAFLEFPGYPGLPEQPYHEARTSAFIGEMQKAQYDIAIQLHGSGTWVNDFVTDIGAAVTVGYRCPGATQLSRTLPWQEDESEIGRWLRLVALLGADPGNTSIELPIFERERALAREILGRDKSGARPLVGLHCGSKLESRRWPVSRFAELGAELWRRYDAQIVLTGNASEAELAGRLQHEMRAPVLNLTGRTDLGTFFAVINELDLLVTNDTGASHVAAATQTPSVVLFGPSRPARWAPLNHELHTVIDARRFSGTEAADDRYLDHLPVEPVLEACSRVLRSVSPGRRAAAVHSIHMAEARV